MLEVVLKDWVTETNETACSSNSSTSLAKSASERVRRSTHMGMFESRGVAHEQTPLALAASKV
jgi:hypothetical protein